MSDSKSSSSKWTTFQTPARQVDFEDAKLQSQMNDLWNSNLQGFTAQGITGNPWTTTNSSDQHWYFNPTASDTTSGKYAQITWSPLPGRIRYYFPNISDQDLWSLADTGFDTEKASFGKITNNPCDPKASQKVSYGPYGPRGWQDEYCEWAITRDARNNIVRIDFTCENPEYWNTLWMVSPERVADLYSSTLDKTIAVADLYLRDRNGTPVVDPSTGRPAYNPLNKWNSGTVSTPTSGGAMHLTSTPNTLQTEIGLASTATTPRIVGNANPMNLICCAQYGQPGRNSDPHIGQVVNQVVTPLNPSNPSSKATLANPPGLYIQSPDFARIKAPKGVDPSAFWTIKRGATSLADDRGTQMPGQFILHAVFEVPAAMGFTVSDLTVDGQPVRWGAQIAQTMLMQIAAMALPESSSPPAQPCAGAPATVLAQPLQLFHSAVFDAMLSAQVANPVDMPMNLASNSTMVAPMVKAGASGVPMTLVLDGVDATTPPKVSFGDGVQVDITGPMQPVTYAIPGNSYPSSHLALPLRVSIDRSAMLGLRGVQATNPNQTPAAAAPALLHIVAP